MRSISVSRILRKANDFTRKRPLLFNSVIYGSFYSGAELARQSYVRMYKLPEPVISLELEEAPRSSSTIHKSELFLWFQRFNESLGLLDEDGSSEANDKYNWPQLKRYAIYGCFLAGPILHGWYKWLDAFFKGKSMRIVLVKLAADQFILTPPLLMMFFISMSLMEGRLDIFGECRIKFLQTFKTSCMYWLPVQFFNFMLIPSALRVSFVSIAAFCWVNILCYFKSIPLPNVERDKVNR